MKRLRCPKCDEAILFDETRYEPGRVLIFECPECHKQFRLRMPQSADATDAQTDAPVVHGSLTVLENDFQVKTVIPLYEGENVIGRHVRGTQANAAFKTVDPSIDTTHCRLRVKIDRHNGDARFYLADAPSNTGTFVQGELLGDREQKLLDDGAVINIGAATLIFEINHEIHP
ncbi:MAG: FHA domain-containing protein [Alloprevotella sp.]|nr:FHA domain-containing protein [Alloprevotella sp.]